MSFSHYAGVAIVPTLSRIVLAAAFITAGYKKVFTSSEYSLDEARKLQNWNITVKPKPATAWMSAPMDTRGAQLLVIAASYRQIEPPATGPATAPAEPPSAPPSAPVQNPPHENPPVVAPAQPVTPVVVPQATQPVEAAPATTAPTMPATRRTPIAVPPATMPATTIPALPDAYTATSMYRIALIADKAGWPQPKTQAWLAAFTELAGGALLLIGLFSRLWGLGLSIVMASAFYLTSYSMLQMHHWNLAALGVPEFNSLFCQLGLFVLAFGILLTGPGPLSIDRILFGGPRDDVDVVEVKRDQR